MGLQKRKKANNKERISLLSEPSGTWNYSDVMKYFGFSYGKANNIIREIEYKKGSIPYYEGKVKRRVRIDDILELFGTSRVNEFKICIMKDEMNNKNNWEMVLSYEDGNTKEVDN